MESIELELQQRPALTPKINNEPGLLGGGDSGILLRPCRASLAPAGWRGGAFAAAPVASSPLHALEALSAWNALHASRETPKSPKSVAPRGGALKAQFGEDFELMQFVDPENEKKSLRGGTSFPLPCTHSGNPLFRGKILVLSIIS